MPWGVAAAAVAAAGSAYSANQQKKSAQGAANSAQRAQDQAYYNNQANLQPYMNTGTNALTQLEQLNSGNYSSFNESPDYQFALNQGLQGLDRSAAARGSLFSGGQTADVLNFASGLANQNYNSYYSKLANLAGLGQSAAGALAGVNTGYANATGNIAGNLAGTTADANSANAGLLSGLASNYLNSLGSSRSSAYGGTAAGNQWAGQASTGQGSNYNFGNNLNNFTWG